MSTYTLGVDVGGTKIQTGLVTRSGKVVRTRRFLIQRKNKTTALASILDSIAQSINSPIRAIGVGITGLVEHPSGIVVQSPNLPDDWKRVPLQSIIKKKYKLPVVVDNDGNCAVIAEATVGAGKKKFSVLSITIGTGLGAGFVVNGKILRGSRNIIEYGHTVIADSSPRCNCGLTGHFEALVSGSAMVKLYRARTKKTKSTHDIVAGAKHADRAAKSVLRTMSHYLAVGLANSIHAYNPDVIVIGGGLSRIPILITPAISLVPQLLMDPKHQKTKIIRSRLGYDAGVIGAAFITKKKTQ